jgi:hypothetical protein
MSEPVDEITSTLSVYQEGYSTLLSGKIEWMESEFESLADHLEQTIPGIAVLGVRRVCVPCQSATISIQLSDDRRLSLVEEFVLESVMHSCELQSIDAVSELLGLDPLFVERSARSLEIANAIEVVDGIRLVPTERTAEILRLKELPSDIETAEIVVTWNPIEQKALRSGDPLFSIEPNGLDLFAPGEVLPEPNWQDVSVISPILAAEHRLEKKKVQITEVQRSPVKWLSLTLTLYRDFLDHATRFTLFRENRPLSRFTETLNLAHADGVWDLGRVFEGCSEPFDETAHPRALALAESTFREQREAPKKVKKHSSLIVIPPRRIRDTFVDILGTARKRVVILSPWINERATNDEILAKFEELVKAGALIIIGYGYDPELKQVEVPEAIEKFLAGLRTIEKAPAVALVRLGNMHAKFVGVDGVKALDGSYNFLSFAGKSKLEHCYFLEDTAAIRDLEAECRERLLLALDGPKAMAHRLTITAALGTPSELLAEVERDLDDRNLLQALMLCLNRHKVDVNAGWDKIALEILNLARLHGDLKFKPLIERVLEDWKTFEPKQSGLFSLEDVILPIPDDTADHMPKRPAPKSEKASKRKSK